jgi:hypothetical protein
MQGSINLSSGIHCKTAADDQVPLSTIARRDDATVLFLKNRILLYKTVPERVKYQAMYHIRENYARQYPA